MFTLLGSRCNIGGLIVVDIDLSHVTGVSTIWIGDLSMLNNKTLAGLIQALSREYFTMLSRKNRCHPDLPEKRISFNSQCH